MTAIASDFLTPHGTVSVADVWLSNVDFSGLKADYWSLGPADLEGCNFSNVRGEFAFGAGARQTVFTDCVFDGARLRAAVMGRSRFVRCSFRNAHLAKWLCTSAEFVECTFTGRIEESNFHRDLAPRLQLELGRDCNEIESNDFSGADFRGVTFGGGVDLRNQQLPQKPGYFFLDRADEVIPSIVEQLSALPATKEIERILSHLRVYLRWEYPTQRQLVFSPLDWDSRDGVRERAFAQLREVLGSSAEDVI